jgi:hypothetical protein
MRLRKYSGISDISCKYHRQVFRLQALISSLIIPFIIIVSLAMSASLTAGDTSANPMNVSNNVPPAISLEAIGDLNQIKGSEESIQSNVDLVPAALDPITLETFTSSTSFGSTQAPNPTIQGMIDQVNRDTIFTYTGDLSGEWPVQIGGQSYTIRTRHTDSGEPIRKATQYVGEHLAALGLQVEYHNWESQSYPNVIGQITGQTNPENIYMITAHLDDQPSGSIAPGADDNASGSVATLIAADILSQYQWGCTLRFALWTGEEQGYEGSKAYADRARNRNENILGVLNLDMIGYDAGGPFNARLYARSSIPGSMDIGNLFINVVQTYGINLEPTLYLSGGSESDNQSFWNEGFAAILGIEGDFNPNYHQTDDTLANLNMEYYTAFVKASVGTFAHMTGCLMDDGPQPTFADVPFDHPYHDEIEILYQAGYTDGCATDPLLFCPDRTLNRAEGAVFTVRSVHGAAINPPQPQTQVFTDTFLTDWPVDWVSQLWEDGYTAGCNADPLMFCPWQAYNRAEGSVFALRMKYGIDFVPPTPTGIFADVSTEDWFIEWVEAAYNEGLIPACQESPLQFCPFDSLDRGIAAYMTVQAKGLTSP